MSNITDFVGVIGTGANVSFNGTATDTAGLAGTFGSVEILGAAGILIMIIIGWKLKAPLDLIAVSSISMLAVLTNSAVGASYLPEYIFWIFVLGGASIFALGLIKFIKYR